MFITLELSRSNLNNVLSPAGASAPSEGLDCEATVDSDVQASLSVSACFAGGDEEAVEDQPCTFLREWQPRKSKAEMRLKIRLF
jgi:hypothetical protein